MKRLIAAALLLIIVALLCFADISLSHHIYRTLSEDIKNCSDAFTNQDFDTAIKYATDLEKNWVEHEGTFSVFINHALIDEMGSSVSRLVPLARNKDAMFLVECRAVEIALKHIKDDSGMSWHSIL